MFRFFVCRQAGACGRLTRLCLGPGRLGGGVAGLLSSFCFNAQAPLSLALLVLAGLEGHRPFVAWVAARAPLSLATAEILAIVAAMGGHEGLLADAAALQPALALPAVRDQKLSTPLMYAAQNGHLGVMEFLRARGCSVRDLDNAGRSPLLWGAIGGQKAAILWLVAHGCDLHQTDDEGDDVLLCASHAGHVDVIEWLLAQGFSLRRASKAGYTPLLYAAGMGRVDFFEWLLAHGSDLHERNSAGNTGAGGGGARRGTAGCAGQPLID